MDNLAIGTMFMGLSIIINLLCDAHKEKLGGHKWIGAAASLLLVVQMWNYFLFQ